MILKRLIQCATTKLLPAGPLLAGLLWACALSAEAATAQESLFSQLTAWTVAQTSSSPEQVKIAPLDPRLQVQACEGTLSFDYPFANHETVRARCAKPNWQLFAKVSLARQRNTVAAARPLAAGQLLAEADIEMRPDIAPTAGSLELRELAIGRQLKRPLGKGQTILAQDLEQTLQAVRLKQALRAGAVLSDALVERVNLQRNAAPASVWLGSELPPGVRLARDMQAGQIVQSADLAESRQVVVAGGNLSAGQLLKPELLKLQTIEQDKVSRTHLFDTSGMEGFELMRAVRAGEPIRNTDLRPALMVKKGELVLFSIGKTSEFQVSIRLEALQDGRIGEQIKLRNNESGRTLNGVVTAMGAVRGM
jgi:flagella basal body P-ring formation protein FlgA